MGSDLAPNFFKGGSLTVPKEAAQVPGPRPGEAVLERLREPFPANKVKTRPGGGGKTLDYVAIETVLDRLLTIAPGYSWKGKLVHFDGKTAVVEGELTVYTEAEGMKTGYGIGAMANSDADMAVKSANSEAMKNAAKNGFGVALELWSEEHRQDLARQRTLRGNPAALKKAVWALAQTKTGKDKPSLADVAKAFKVDAADLTEVATLEAILEGEGLL